MLAGEVFTAGQGQAGHPGVALHIRIPRNRRHLLLEANFAAQADDLGAHVLHHFHQLEGADVGFGLGENVRGRARLHEFVEHLAPQVTPVFHLAVQLAVGEGAGAALAELHIGFGLQPALAPQAPGVFGALAHVPAPLQHDGSQAHLRQQQRRQNAAGAEADHQGALLPCSREIGTGLGHRDITGIRAGHNRGACGRRRQQRFLQRRIECHVQLVDQLDGGFFTGVNAALEYRNGLDIVHSQLQPARDRRRQFRRGVIQR